MNRSRRGLYIISFLCSYQEMTQRIFYVGSPCMWDACTSAKDKNCLVPATTVSLKSILHRPHLRVYRGRRCHRVGVSETRRLVPHKMRRIDTSLWSLLPNLPTKAGCDTKYFLCRFPIRMYMHIGRGQISQFPRKLLHCCRYYTDPTSLSDMNEKSTALGLESQRLCDFSHFNWGEGRYYVFITLKSF